MGVKPPPPAAARLRVAAIRPAAARAHFPVLSRYNEMAEPALSDAWFEAKPMVLLIGQYSVGKTSFINYLLGRGFAGSRVGPEMTTDRFVAVMYGDAEKTTPGNALTSQPDTPFHSLKKYGTNFLNRLEAAALPSPILKRVTLVDSPGAPRESERPRAGVRARRRDGVRQRCRCAVGGEAARPRVRLQRRGDLVRAALGPDPPPLRRVQARPVRRVQGRDEAPPADSFPP